jgi:uncharacterized cupin superfamily protein
VAAGPEVFNLLDGELEAGRFQDRSGYGWRGATLGERLGAKLLGMSVYELEPGQRTFPYHYHLGMEEWLLVLSGTLTLRAPDGEQVLGAGDTVAFPDGPEGAHQIRNDGDAAARVAILSTKPEMGAAVYPDSGKLALRAPALGEQHLVRDAPQLDYWDGEN